MNTQWLLENLKNPHYSLSQIDPRVVVRRDDFDQGASAMLAVLIAWLEEPCDKHEYKGTYDQQTGDFISIKAWHRKDCSQCWQELEDGVK